MRLILGMQILLRALIDPLKLSTDTRAMLQDPGHEVMFSVASIWEIAIKSALGQADFSVSPAVILAAALTEPAMLYTADAHLEIYSELVLRVGR